MKKIILTIIILPLVAYCQSFVPNAPELDLKSYILIEPNTNTVIAEFNSSDLIEPASMTKVMTGYVVSDQIKNELISLNDQVLISEKAWKMEGSKMFIEVGKKVSILDLLKGIIYTIRKRCICCYSRVCWGNRRWFCRSHELLRRSTGDE